MSRSTSKDAHALETRRWQTGSLGPTFGASLRVVATWSADGQVDDVCAAVVVDEWVIERSLVIRDQRGDVVPGALRVGELEWRLLIRSTKCLALDEQRAASRDYAESSPDIVTAALEAMRARHRARPTTRQLARARSRLSAEAIRAVLGPMLTSPALGSDLDAQFLGWGRQLDDWRVAAGPLAPQGQKRVVQGTGDPLDPDSLVEARRDYRDRARALPTEPDRIVDARGATIEVDGAG